MEEYLKIIIESVGIFSVTFAIFNFKIKNLELKITNLENKISKVEADVKNFNGIMMLGNQISNNRTGIDIHN